MDKFVAYYRVSTAKQGTSGLGLEAQRKAVLNHIGPNTLKGEFTEIESGKRNDRPELDAALRHAKLTGSTLIVAKLDRLSRNVAFLAALQDSGAKFIAADNPTANELTIHILAAVAQAERKAISQRTREALAAARARGRKLGGKRANQRTPNASERQRSIEVRQAQAKARQLEVMPYIEEARDAGYSSLAGIAGYLNERGIRTARGGQWFPASVARVLS